ncbi:hypothetical protein QFC22_002201 [Naganishia vaughanmartiniae]|uniref:Uncharacterized protein n=1 Tax=Naganishia vaughanmartiniae TaxID=1424756 RepID=A0ACC2XCC7_9TREE|nr:hypothetical protein QFC22_002201 [Naganishia vaughanmartiniae]
MSASSSKLSSSSGSSAVRVRTKSPSYLLPTAASMGKRRDKASFVKLIKDWEEEQEKRKRRKNEENRKRASKNKSESGARTAGYLKSTKAASGKMAVRKYKLQGVQVEVPQLAFRVFEDSEEDMKAYARLQWAQGYQTTDDLFAGRHTYRDSEGRVVLEREDWKEQMALQHGIDVDEARRCRVLGIEYESY